MTIRYEEDPQRIEVDQLGGGFFDGWPVAPTPEQHIAHLRASEVAICAIDTDTNMVVGFVTALGDGVLTAFVSLLEVLPAHRRRGIGSELVRRVLSRLDDRYSIDLVCDPDLVPFYERFGGRPLTAMAWRNALHDPTADSREEAVHDAR